MRLERRASLVESSQRSSGHWPPSRRTPAALVVLSLAATAVTQAQVPAGGEFQVNAYTTGNQQSPAVAVDGQGNFVVAWDSDGSSGTDTSGGVQARRYSANGVPLDGEFQANFHTPDGQFSAAVAVDSQGNFVVAWQGLGSSGTDTVSSSIQARRFAANGTPLGGDLQVNTYGTGQQLNPDVAVDAQGNFVVAWMSAGSAGTDTDAYSIHAQRYDANGAPQGGELQVNTYTTNQQRNPVVAMDGPGNFVVAWHSYGSDTDASNYSIQAQRYAANGAPLGGQFQVNSYTTGSQAFPDVAVNGQGDFLLVWGSDGSSATDTGGWSIQTRRYAANGAPFGGELQVNSYTTGDQLFPTVAPDGHGSFVAAWNSDGSNGTDTSNASIQARRIDANGAPVGAELQVNTFTAGSQTNPFVAVDGQGNFVVVWASEGSSGNDTSYRSVQGQRYSSLVFDDDFESRNTLAWDAQAPPLTTTDVFRWTDLDLRDPHVYIQSIGCNDHTPHGAFGFSVNDELAASLVTDANTDGFLDRTHLTVFRPLDADAVGGRLDDGAARCGAPNPPASCDWTDRWKQTPLTFTYDTLPASGTCLEPIAATTNGGYSPAISTPTAPCFWTELGTVAIDFFGVLVPLQDAQVAAQFVGDPPTSLVSGLSMGFLLEADADATILPGSLPFVGGQPLSILFPGGSGNCAAHNDRDTWNGQSGWWVYFNFVASPVNFVGR